MWRYLHDGWSLKKLTGENPDYRSIVQACPKLSIEGTIGRSTFDVSLPLQCLQILQHGSPLEVI